MGVKTALACSMRTLQVVLVRSCLPAVTVVRRIRDARWPLKIEGLAGGRPLARLSAKGKSWWHAKKATALQARVRVGGMLRRQGQQVLVLCKQTASHLSCTRRLPPATNLKVP